MDTDKGLTTRKLEKLAEFYGRKYFAIQEVLGMLGDNALTMKQQRTPKMIGDALRLDQVRRNGDDGVSVHNGATPHAQRWTPEQRARQSKRIAAIHKKRKLVAGKPLTTLKKTKVEFMASRKVTAKFLAQFSTSTPHMPANGDSVKFGLGSMVRHGYLKAKGDGYISTGKEFIVDRWHGKG